MGRKNSVSVGIDVAAARRGLDLVALDGKRHVVAVHSRLSIAEAARVVMRELEPAIVCIDSPAQWSTSGSSRMAERALLRMGIHAFYTPAEARAVPFHDWMRAGFAVYDALSAAYPRYRGGEARGTAAECFPHATAVLLAGRVGQFNEKYAFRRRVLEDNGVVTTALRTRDQVDAALAALTGRIALDGGFSWVGDADEGALLLPVAVLPAHLPRETGALGAAPGQLCGCGCGEPVRREFLPGHDAKLRSQLLKQAAAGTSAADELKRRGWVSS